MQKVSVPRLRVRQGKGGVPVILLTERGLCKERTHEWGRGLDKITNARTKLTGPPRKGKENRFEGKGRRKREKEEAAE